MTQKRNIETLFDAALEIESATERAAYLAQVCDGDSALQDEIKRLLDADTHSKGPLDRQVVSSLDTVSNSVLESLSRAFGDVPKVLLRDGKDTDTLLRVNALNLPKEHGRYQLFGEMTRGGMGAIVKGRDTDLGRDLVLKVLLESHQENSEYVQRFVEEAQIAGQLQHPGIVPVYELGQLEDQRPFFTMKLVKGQTLAAILSDRKDVCEDSGKLIGIFEQICQTVAYAHSKGVIHRDLKPANVMIGAFGEVQVMDWGLAKVLSEGGVSDERKSQQKHSQKTIIRTLRHVGSDTGAVSGSETRYGSVMGTFAYMPPEQASGEVDRLDERADVFALGSILAEIFTGSPAYVAEDSSEKHRLAMRGKLDDCFARLDVCEADQELIELTKECLAPEPHDRPRNANAVATRVADFQAGIETRLKQAELDKVVSETQVIEEQRRRKLVVAISTFLLLAASITAIVFWQLSEQNGLLAAGQEKQRQKAEAALDLTRVIRLVSSPVFRGSRPVNSLLFAAEAAELSRQQDGKLHPTIHEALLNTTATIAGEPLSAHQGGDFDSVAMSPDGSSFATTSVDGTVRVWDLTEGQIGRLRHVLPGHTDRINTIRYSPDGSRLATQSSRDGTVSVWNMRNANVDSTRQEFPGCKEPGFIVPLLFSSDGDLLISGGPTEPTTDGQIYTARVWDLNAKDPVSTFKTLRKHEDAVLCAALSPDDRWLYTGSRDRTICVWDLTQSGTSSPVRTEKVPGYVAHMSLRPDGKSLWTMIWSKGGMLWNISDDKLSLHTTDKHASIPSSRFSPLNRRLAILRRQGELQEEQLVLWDLTADNPQASERVLPDLGVERIAGFSADERWLLTHGNGTARLWDLDADEPSATMFKNGHDGQATWAMSPKARWLVSASLADRTARIWDCSRPLPGESPLLLPGGQPPSPTNSFSSVELSPGGLLATSDGDAVRFWEFSEQGPVSVPFEIRDKGGIETLVFCAKNGRLFTGGTDGTVKVWDVPARDSRPVHTYFVQPEAVRNLAVSPNGRWLASSIFDTEKSAGDCHLWDLNTPGDRGKPKKKYVLDDVWASKIAFSGDSRWLVTSKLYYEAIDATSKLWDLRQADPIRSAIDLPGQSPDRSMHASELSPDGQWLITGSENNEIRVYNLNADAPIATESVVNRREGPVRMVAISSDGRTAWCARWAAAGTNEVWDLEAANKSDVVNLLHPINAAAVGAISDNGQWLAVGSDDGRIHLWDMSYKTFRETALSHMILEGHSRSVSDVKFTPDSKWLISCEADVTRVWPLDVDQLLTISRRLAGRQLTEREKALMYDRPSGPTVERVE